MSVRPATFGDAAAIRALVNTIDAVETGDAGYSIAEVEGDLRQVAELTTDSWLAFDGAALVAYAVLWPEGTRHDVDHYVLPGHLDAGERLVDLLMLRAAAIAADRAGPEVHLQLALPPGSLLAGASLTDRGWSVVRRHRVLRRPLDPAVDIEPAPAGVTVRQVAGPADQEVAYRLVQDSFAGHFGFEPSDYDAWRRRVNADTRDWSLSWIAAADGADVGVCMAHNDRETMGYVQFLGTTAAARGRGVGTVLLRTAFAAFAARGRDAIGLGVDTGNATNALSLYTGLGMTLLFAVDTWEHRRPLP